LAKRDGRVGIFVGDHREDEHGKGEHEIAELLQATVLGSGASKVKRGIKPSQNRVPLDLAYSAAYVFGLSSGVAPDHLVPSTEVAVPRIKSAAKRMRQARSRATLNRTHRSQLRSAVKRVRSAAAADAKAAYDEAVKLLDRAGKKNIIHRNAAARQKSRLAKLVAGKK
jgi:small subunit ribosomal protein S20